MARAARGITSRTSCHTDNPATRPKPAQQADHLEQQQHAIGARLDPVAQGKQREDRGNAGQQQPITIASEQPAAKREGPGNVPGAHHAQGDPDRKQRRPEHGDARGQEVAMKDAKGGDAFDRLVGVERSQQPDRQPEGEGEQHDRRQPGEHPTRRSRIGVPVSPSQ